DSTYNASPGSMGVVIDNFSNLADSLYPDYEKILVLGEMRELGDYSKDEHEKLAKKSFGITKNIFVVGEDMNKYFIPKSQEIGNKNVLFYKNSKLLGADLKSFIENKTQKYIILFKGSQNTIFLEESVKILQLNKKDNSKVCRQQKFWLDNKNIFFNNY
ncbi:MAG: hypothetical protein NWP80_00445, partial [Candidatus Gracilibacteria bacterium]|nr:hypothetical protein [Candidatus Gracilibacteria bacterium]